MAVAIVWLKPAPPSRAQWLTEAQAVCAVLGQAVALLPGMAPEDPTAAATRTWRLVMRGDAAACMPVS